MPTVAIWHARQMDNIVCNTKLMPISMYRFVAVAVNIAAVTVAMGAAIVL